MGLFCLKSLYKCIMCVCTYHKNVSLNTIKDHFKRQHDNKYKSIEEQEYLRIKNNITLNTMRNVTVIEDDEEYITELPTRPIVNKDSIYEVKDKYMLNIQHSIKNSISEKEDVDLKKNLSFDYGSKRQKIGIIIDDKNINFQLKESRLVMNK
ncbi:26460_t:CDS:2 [Dentiscutata erythropus]|uniref:26460_t:CDS:1 n=1 Tax=Dentiscutata erythropus TaxID=1348616 RepID=A0A9N8Z0B6_9GLOM|nr:26460_t:CDS:2 [Dentiscutata erythropus]